jgi:methylase of polypeptide subunit release factors
MRDPWLHRWMPLVVERAGDDPILELGCGSGDDSVTLASRGLPLVAVDLSEQAIAKARRREVIPRGVADPQLDEKITHKYSMPKALWEVALEKAA